MEEVFKSKVELELDSFFAANHFSIDSISTKDGGNFISLVYQSQLCQIQIYSSNRDGEINCKLSLPTASPSSNKNNDKKNNWYFLNELLPGKQELTIEQLIAAIPASPKSVSEQLHELSEVLSNHFQEALAALQSLEQGNKKENGTKS